MDTCVALLSNPHSVAHSPLACAPDPCSAPLALTDASGSTLTIQNVVATVQLGIQLDLRQIALHARNAEYNPRRFAAVIMRLREPRCTALLFSTGKLVVTGARSADDAHKGARKYAAIVKRIGFAPHFRDFKIQNMVATYVASPPLPHASLNSPPIIKKTSRVCACAQG